MKEILGKHIKISRNLFGLEDAFHLEKKIKSVLNRNYVVICVFDVDTVENNPTNKAKFDRLKKKYSNKRKGVVLCDSLTSLEYWFLIHYEDTNRYFNNCDDVIESLIHYIPNYEKTEKFLKNKKWVVDMVADNRLDDAITRAKQYPAGEGSYTNMYRAIEKIMGTK